MAGKKNRSRNSTQNFTVRPTMANNLTQPNRLNKSVDELLTMTKEQLKTECRKRGQKCTGTKAELVTNLNLFQFQYIACIYFAWSFSLF